MRDLTFGECLLEGSERVYSDLENMSFFGFFSFVKMRIGVSTITHIPSGPSFLNRDEVQDER